MNETKPAEVRIVSTEFRYAPVKVVVTAGRAVTLILDNSRAETEHVLFLPAFGFRLQAKAGEIARKTIVFEKLGDMNSIAICQATAKRAWRGRWSLALFDRPLSVFDFGWRRGIIPGSGTISPVIFQRETMLQDYFFKGFGEQLMSFTRTAALPAVLCISSYATWAPAEEAQNALPMNASSPASADEAPVTDLPANLDAPQVAPPTGRTRQRFMST